MLLRESPHLFPGLPQHCRQGSGAQLSLCCPHRCSSAHREWLPLLAPARMRAPSCLNMFLDAVADVDADAASQVLQTPPQPCRRRSSWWPPVHKRGALALLAYIWRARACNVMVLVCETQTNPQSRRWASIPSLHTAGVRLPFRAFSPLLTFVRACCMYECCLRDNACAVLNTKPFPQVAGLFCLLLCRHVHRVCRQIHRCTATRFVAVVARAATACLLRSLRGCIDACCNRRA